MFREPFPECSESLFQKQGISRDPVSFEEGWEHKSVHAQGTLRDLEVSK